MTKRETITNLKLKLKQTSREIDRIVLDGGRVGYGDPLLQLYHRLRSQLTALQRPKLPGVR